MFFTKEITSMYNSIIIIFSLSDCVSTMNEMNACDISTRVIDVTF